LKGDDKIKGKWPSKKVRHQDVDEKENVSPYKKFNVVDKGRGSQLGEQQTRGDGRGPLQCWICGKDHCKKDCPL